MDLDVFHFDDDRPNFETLSQDNGFHFWWGSQLMEALGYDNAFEVARSKPVQRAMTACNSLGIPIQENFIFLNDDVKLTRFACYLVAMNADPKKPQVAAAQAYFATLAVQFSQFAQENEVMDRVLTREEITQQERSLSSVVKHSGVENYAFFQNAGYRGMYNMNLKSLKDRKNVPANRSPLDFMGATESAANLLRIRLTEDKIEGEKVYGQNSLENAANTVGKEIRDILKRTIGKRPEDLPPAPDILQVQKGLKNTSKGFMKIDAPQKKARKGKQDRESDIK